MPILRIGSGRDFETVVQDEALQNEKTMLRDGENESQSLVNRQAVEPLEQRTPDNSKGIPLEQI